MESLRLAAESWIFQRGSFIVVTRLFRFLINQYGHVVIECTFVFPMSGKFLKDADEMGIFTGNN